jgi:hypothetical protein
MAAREIVECGLSAHLVDVAGLCPRCGLPVAGPFHDTGGAR